MTIQPETFAAVVSALIYAGGAWSAFKIEVMGWKDTLAKFLILAGLTAGIILCTMIALGFTEIKIKGG